MVDSYFFNNTTTHCSIPTEFTAQKEAGLFSPLTNHVVYFYDSDSSQQRFFVYMEPLDISFMNNASMKLTVDVALSYLIP